MGQHVESGWSCRRPRYRCGRRCWWCCPVEEERLGGASPLVRFAADTKRAGYSAKASIICQNVRPRVVEFEEQKPSRGGREKQRGKATGRWWVK